MLTIVGLGLCDARDITLRGLDAIQNADHVYLEAYTSILQCSHADLEQSIGRTITKLSRQDVEQAIEQVLEIAKTTPVCILVIGDPFSATTHADLYLRARRLNIVVDIIHNASILTAVGAVGLELYKYGRTVSIPYWTTSFEPKSFVRGIEENYERGLHTLCLLDITTEVNRYMTIKEGINQLLLASNAVVTTKIIGVARMGCPDQCIRYGTIEQVKTFDFGPPPHSLIIPGKLHQIEEEMSQLWQIE